MCAFLRLVSFLCLQSKQWIYRGRVIVICCYEEGHLKCAGVGVGGAAATELLGVQIQECHSGSKFDIFVRNIFKFYIKRAGFTR